MDGATYQVILVTLNNFNQRFIRGIPLTEFEVMHYEQLSRLAETHASILRIHAEQELLRLEKLVEEAEDEEE